MKMPIAEIALDPRCQMRERLDDAAIDEYAERYREGDAMPPVSVFRVRKAIACVDGFHRIAGAFKAGETFIDVEEVGKGSWDDAQWYALSVNHGHGVRRTNADKRRAVEQALSNPIAQEQSGRAIAKQCGVSHTLVDRMRAEWEAAQGGIRCHSEVALPEALPGDGTPLDDDFAGGFGTAPSVGHLAGAQEDGTSRTPTGRPGEAPTHHRGQAQVGRPGDHRCTPEVLWRVALEAIGAERFEVDPACNRHSTVPAAVQYCAPEQDGLVERWYGHVWINPPFSDITPWVDRVESYQGAPEVESVTFIGPHDLSTSWAQRMTRLCDAWAAWPRREHFPQPGQPTGSPPAGIAFWYLGDEPEEWMRVMRFHGAIAYPGHPAVAMPEAAE